jgi:spermidine synthase
MTDFASSKASPAATPSDNAGIGAIALPVVAVAIFTAAALLFCVQPMFGKMALPLLGGSSAVWTALLLFFQTALLLGYLYAHALGTLLPTRLQICVHLVVVALAALALPVAIPDGSIPDGNEAPVVWLIAILTVAVGVPYTVIAATSPLLQRWFAQSGHKSASDPYYLYVASNAGSLIGLLGYPLVMEPLVGVSAQSTLWTTGYLLLVVMMAASAIVIWRLAPTGTEARVRKEAAAPARITNFDRFRWMALAFVPSSLLLGVTTHITSDIAAVPLLWAVPLALYLVTFMFAFAQKRLIGQAIMLKAENIAFVMLCAFMWFGSLGIVELVVHLLAFFIIALARHGALADTRPDASRLTEFYLWMSAGGALGGVFNAVIAPHVFTTVLEYPVMIAAAAATRLLVPGGASSRFNLTDLAVPAIAAVGIAGFWLSGQRAEGLSNVVVLVIVVPLALATYHLRARTFGFALGVASMFVLAQAARHNSSVLMENRSFFGAYRVQTTSDGKYVLFRHGTTLHGAQSTDPARRHEALSYYSAIGPFGRGLTALEAARPQLRVGLIGLGSGTSVCYARPADTWTLYEIDPLVVHIARDSGAFSFIKDCAPDARVVVGDARLSLDREPDGAFDVLVLDAFSSDAIPIHLITREALSLARKKLAPGGVIFANISNRYLRREPVLANSAQSAGLVGIAQYFRGPKPTKEEPASASHWVAMAVDRKDLADVEQTGGWHSLAPDPDTQPWTDDYSNLLAVIALKAR